VSEPRSHVGTDACLLAPMAVRADEERGYESILIPLLILAVGVGLSMSPSTTAITASLAEEKQGVASALNDTVREMRGAIGIALLGSVLNASYPSHVSAAADRLPPEPAEPAKEGVGGALAAASGMGGGGAGIVGPARSAFTDGMRPAVAIGAAVSVASALFTVLSGRRAVPGARRAGRRWTVARWTARMRQTPGTCCLGSP
jgi:hypothetical protein